MAQRRGKKYGRPQASFRFRHDLLMMSIGFVLAVVFSAGAFELLNLQFHWTGDVQPSQERAMPVHGAAQENTLSASPDSGPVMTVTKEPTGPLAAVPGEKDVNLLRFTLSPSDDGFVHGMTFVLDEIAHPYDLKRLKLYFGDRLLGEVSFFEGKGSFRNLMLRLSANRLLTLQLVGEVSTQAPPGDRLQLKFDHDGLDASNADGETFRFVGLDALKGTPVSIVHPRR
ncbi:MAG: hypothetical protein U0519_03445 [Candidatus Gracilibacteria bacterium]